MQLKLPPLQQQRHNRAMSMATKVHRWQKNTKPRYTDGQRGWQPRYTDGRTKVHRWQDLGVKWGGNNRGNTSLRKY